ncbi:hypothetical protein H6P81_021207 [Aristolochia fimbriata]|uniref:Uncharacterized protein n=1 Tax=Aristolochia fimbriata TaxID=158543 RepID=A0AAV7DQH2_ARIFI|nr:hypothetical protein H6P81_021207 [Aristolochia fimbriata]
MSRRSLAAAMNLGLEPGGAAVGADLGGSSKYSNENFEGEGERFHVSGTCTWPAHPGSGSAVGSSGWKSTAASAWCRCARRPLKIRRTECARLVVLITHQVSKVNSLWSMEQCRQGKSAKWIRNREKDWLEGGWARGSQSNPSAVGGLLELLLGGGEVVVDAGRGDGLGSGPLGGLRGVEQPTQN